MPLSSATGYEEYKRLNEMHVFETFGRKASASGANQLVSGWRNAGSSGSTQGNVACASTTLGSLWASSFWPAPTTNNLWLTEIEAHMSTNSISAFSAILIDRLVQTDGAVFNVATTQTINSTTLTRSTDGVGNMMAAMIWTSGALTSIALTVKYTDTTGTTGRTAPAVQVTGVIANRIFPIPLAAGDKGVKVVEECQFASSGTAAGNLGFIIYRPLAVFPLGNMPSDFGEKTEPYRNMMVGGGFAMSSIMSSACLDAFTLTQFAAASEYQYRLNFIETT